MGQSGVIHIWKWARSRAPSLMTCTIPSSNSARPPRLRASAVNALTYVAQPPPTPLQSTAPSYDLLPMTDAPQPHRGFTCLTCGYDLHTLPIERSRIRCPECGQRNDLSLLRRRSAVGQQRRRGTDLDMTVFVGLVIVTAFIAAFDGASSMGDRVALLFGNPLGFGVTTCLTLLTLGVLRFVESGLLLWERATLVTVALALLVILNPPWSLVMLVAWWWAFRWRCLQGFE